MVKKKLVVLTGAGISAESGLKTFRDSDGLWEGYNVEEVATPGAWRKDPKLVLDFYNMRRKDVRNAQPNVAHKGLAELEKDFDVHIITQNIDDLHERAGSSKVLHLHGEIFKMRSEKNEHLVYDITDDIQIGDKGEDGAQLHFILYGLKSCANDGASRTNSSYSRHICCYRHLAVPGCGYSLHQKIFQIHCG